MKPIIFKLPILFFLSLASIFISCNSDDSAPEEEEFFRIVVDGISADLTYTNAVDVSGDNSIFVSGGLYPDAYTITIVADAMTSTGNISCAENETPYSVRLGYFSDPDDSLSLISYDDGDDTCQSSITITRNNTYIEGSFTATLTETSTSTPSIITVSGSFKVREDED